MRVPCVAHVNGANVRPSISARSDVAAPFHEPFERGALTFDFRTMKLIFELPASSTR